MSPCNIFFADIFERFHGCPPACRNFTVSKQQYKNKPFVNFDKMSTGKRPAESETINDSSNDEVDAGESKRASGDELESKTKRNRIDDPENLSLHNSCSYDSVNQTYSKSNKSVEAGEKFRKQNYSCFTPTINSVNSYTRCHDTQAGLAHTTQSINYTHEKEATSHASPQKEDQRNFSFHQPSAIPTYSAAVNATAMKNLETSLCGSSQKQIWSSFESHQGISKPEDLDEAIDLTMHSPVIECAEGTSRKTSTTEPSVEGEKLKAAEKDAVEPVLEA